MATPAQVCNTSPRLLTQPCPSSRSKNIHPRSTTFLLLSASCSCSSLWPTTLSSAPERHAYEPSSTSMAAFRSSSTYFTSSSSTPLPWLWPQPFAHTGASGSAPTSSLSATSITGDTPCPLSLPFGSPSFSPSTQRAHGLAASKTAPAPGGPAPSNPFSKRKGARTEWPRAVLDKSKTFLQQSRIQRNLSL